MARKKKQPEVQPDVRIERILLATVNKYIVVGVQSRVQVYTMSPELRLQVVFEYELSSTVTSLDDDSLGIGAFVVTESGSVYLLALPDQTSAISIETIIERRR